MIEKTEAVVLKSIKYGDTSRIVTLYTRDFGKISVIAKGARTAKSRFGAALDVMCRSHIVLYRKEHRDLQLLSQADLVQQYRHMMAKPDFLMAGFAALEFIYKTVQGEEAHEDLYQHLIGTLNLLDTGETDAQTILLRFLTRLVFILGVGLDMTHCIDCRTPLTNERSLDKRVAFSISNGGCTCIHCTPKADTLSLDRMTVLLLQALQHTFPEHTLNPDADRSIRQEAVELLHRYLLAHIDGMRPVRSMDSLYIFDSFQTIAQGEYG